MKFKIRKELNDIIELNESIIGSLKAQKVRQDELQEKYEQEVRDEIDIPSNQQRAWSRIIRQYIDHIISGKLIDFEILKRYKEFIKEVVKYESQYILQESFVRRLEFCADFLAETVLKLEKKIIALRANNEEALIKVQKKLIRTYQKVPKSEKKGGLICPYCGNDLNSKNDKENMCFRCAKIPRKELPFLRKDNFVPIKRKPKPRLSETAEVSEVSETAEASEVSEKDPKKVEPKPKEDFDSEETKQQKSENKREEKPKLTKKEEDVKKEFSSLMERFEKEYEKRNKDPVKEMEKEEKEDMKK